MRYQSNARLFSVVIRFFTRIIVFVIFCYFCFIFVYCYFVFYTAPCSVELLVTNFYEQVKITIMFNPLFARAMRSPEIYSFEISFSSKYIPLSNLSICFHLSIINDVKLDFHFQYRYQKVTYTLFHVTYIHCFIRQTFQNIAAILFILDMFVFPLF